MQLRNYQKKALDKATCWFDKEITNPLIVLPTGGGKTVVFATLIKQLYQEDCSRRFLILAHRQELIQQAKDKLLAVWPEAPVGILAASLKEFNQTASIIIASRDTISSPKRLEKSHPVDYIIIDEAHHVGTEKNCRYKKIINHFEEIGCPKVLGVTATPYRMGQGYIYGNDTNHFFGGLAHKVTIPELIKQGYLSRLSAFAVSKDAVIDASKARVKFKGGDYRESDLERLALVDATIICIINDWLEKAYLKGRTSTVFFCVSVLHAQKMDYFLKQHGINSACITAETPTELRNKYLEQFERGEINALCNVAVLTEGWDAPKTDCIAILRPTKSLGLYVQICGRGMRTHEGKDDCLLLDYGGNMERHGCIDKATPERTKGKAEGEAKDLTWICGECFRVNDKDDKYCYECDEPKPIIQPSLIEQIMEKKEAEASETTEAAHGYVLSDEMPDKGKPVERSEEVDRIFAKRKTSKNGNDYLSVEFHTKGNYWPQSTALMVGMYGNAGQMAKKKWGIMSKGKPYPYDIDRAVSEINQHGVFNDIKTINIRKEGKYWNVIGVNF
jgi:DNA repair protein RadD